MGFFSAKHTIPSTLSQLQVDINNAVEKGQYDRVSTLIEANEVIIRNEFPKWKIVPVDCRKPPGVQKWYCEGLLYIAQYYENKGNSEYIQMMMGNDANNPIARWQKVGAEAQQAFVENRYQFAVDVLLPVIEDMKALSGSAVDEMLGKYYGIVGSSYYKMGKMELGVKFMLEALNECERVKDTEGIEIYKKNLQAMGFRLTNR